MHNRIYRTATSFGRSTFARPRSSRSPTGALIPAATLVALANTTHPPARWHRLHANQNPQCRSRPPTLRSWRQTVCNFMVLMAWEKNIEGACLCPAPYCLLPTFNHLLPTSDFLLPYCLLPTPYTLHPTPYYLRLPTSSAGITRLFPSARLQIVRDLYFVSPCSHTHACSAHTHTHFIYAYTHLLACH